MSKLYNKVASDNINISGTYQCPVVVVGEGTNVIAYSSDGLTYTSSNTTLFNGKGYSVKFNGSVYIACGDANGGATNAIAWSANGKNNWNTFTTTPYVNIDVRGISFSDNKCYLSAGHTTENKFIMISILTPPFIVASLINYQIPISTTLFYNGTDYRIQTIFYSDNIILAGGSGTNTIAYSYDGSAYIGLGTSIIATRCYGFAYNGSTYVAVGGSAGSSTVAYSSNGISWTTVSPSPFSLSGRGVCWNGKMFVAVGQNTGPIGAIVYSKDGIVWKSVSSTPFSIIVNDVCWNGKFFTAVGQSTGPVGTIANSNNGVTWSTAGITSGVFTTNASGCCAMPIIQTPTPGINNTGSTNSISLSRSNQPQIDFTTGGNGVATILNKGFSKLKLDSQIGTFIRSTGVLGDSADDKIMLSVDGILYYDYNATLADASQLLKAVAWNGYVYVLGLSDGKIITTFSLGNISTSSVTLGTTIYAIIWTGSIFIALSNGSFNVHTSTNGTTWMSYPSSNLITTSPVDIAWNGQTAIIVGSGTANISRTTDFITYTTQNTSIISAANCVIWTGSLFLVGGTFSTSTIVTLTRPLTLISDALVTTSVTSVFTTSCTSFATNGSTIVASGSGTFALAYSTNGGTTWTGVSSPTTVAKVYWNGLYFIAFNSGSNPNSYYSSDGISWTSNNITSGFSIVPGNVFYGGYWKWSGNSAYPEISTNSGGANGAGIFNSGRYGLGISAKSETVADFNNNNITLYKPLTVNGLISSNNGAVATPSYSFVNELTSGLYRNASNDLRMSVAGVDISSWNTSGYTLYKPLTNAFQPILKRYVSSTQTINSGSTTAINFQSSATNEVNGGITQNAGFTYSGTTFTCVTAGTYLITLIITYPSNATGQRFHYLEVNGSTTIRYCSSGNAGHSTSLNIFNSSDYINFIVNDTFQCYIFQNSGGGLDIYNTQHLTKITIIKLV